MEQDTFTGDTVLGPKTFHNIVARWDPAPHRPPSNPSEPQPLLVLAAHYDSKLFPGRTFTGASDSVASCAVLLDIALNITRRHSPVESAHRPPALVLVFFDGEEAMGLGSLGKAGVRIVTAQQKQGLSDKAKKKYGLHRPVGAAGGAGVSGLSSSLAFTPVVGMELANPLAAKIAKKTQEDGTKSVYFGDTRGFGKVSKGGQK